MTQATTAGYNIPDIDAQMRRFRLLWLLIPVTALAFGAWGYHRRGMDGFYDLLTIGAGGVLFLLIPTFIVIAVVYGIKQKAVWARHTFEWYRTTFPAHAHAKGRVSCRHCGSEHVRAERLLNRTFMRVHSCGQCGKTLYFSPEQR